jgi:hypothetical protein
MFDADEMFRWVEHQAGFGPRRAGSPGGRTNEDFLAAQLQAFGLENVRKEPIPVTYQQADHTLLLVGAGDDLAPMAAFAIPYAAFTPEGGIEAPLVFADSSALFERGNLQGAIVVTEIRFPPYDLGLLKRVSPGHHDPDDAIDQVDHPATFVRQGWHLYRVAVERGAVGFIGVLRDQTGGTCEMYAPYGFQEADILDKPLPGVWVSRGDGERLIQLARSGTGRARLMVNGQREPGLTHNVVGEIPGRSDEVMILSCHHDSPFASPVEDGTGVSVVLALARHFAEARSLNRRLIVLFSAGHFYGSIGTRSFIRDHPTDVVARAALEVSIEHIALEAGEDAAGNLVPTGKTEATGIFVPLNPSVAKVVLDHVVAQDLRRTILLPAEGPLGDYPPTDGGDWYEAGVPVINYISNPVYLLTSDDSLKWVDKDRLPRVAAAFAAILRDLDTMPRASIGAVRPWFYGWLMKVLRRVVLAKVSALGLKPVH